MPDTSRPNSEERMTALPPEPVLGLDANARLEAVELILLVQSRIALGFSLIAFLFDLYLIATTPDYRASLASLVILGGFWTIGLGMGIGAWRARNGKAAVALSLLALILGIL